MPEKEGWRRFMPSWKVVLGVMGIGTLASICMVGVAYAMVKVPKVNSDATIQGSTIYYSDGKTVLGKIGSSRTIVQFDQISPAMQNAALAAEDRKFYSESAISPTGIARAMVNNLSGGDTQGGSTITQQYVKNAYLNQQRTITRKFKELFIAVKVGKQQDKKTILQNYLNTIYFGRGANGIEAAAQAYYGVPAKNLTIQQAAVLAAAIKEPDDGSGTSYYDPRSTGKKRADAVGRYNFVLNGMVKMGQLSPQDYAKYKDRPAMTIKYKEAQTYAGQRGYLIQRTKNVMRNMGISEADLQTKGLKIYTTWDQGMQAKAKTVVERTLTANHLPSDTRVGLVTIDPKNGEIKAAYGGKDYLKRYFDDAFQSTAQVGSGFKPYVLATALSQGIGLKSRFDASAPAWIDTKGDRVSQGGDAFQVHNDEGNPTNPIVDLVTATQMSYNTVYVPLGFKAGSDNVESLAEKAGLPDEAMKPHVGQAGFFLGQSSMTVLDQATGYATMANDGEYIRPHTIRRVLDSQSHPYMQSKWKNVEHRRAFDADVAHDTQYAMQSVVKTGGTGFRAALPGRQVAGKTGTTNENKAAWFNGFTPKQLVTSVGMWRYDDAITKGKHKRAGRYLPMVGIGGIPRVNGGDFPARIWHDYMSAVLQGKEATTFPPPAYVGDDQAFATPKPSPDPTPSDTPTPTCLPNQNPMRDHCKPDDGGGQNPDCTMHPNRPQCPDSTPPTTPTCNPLTGCHTPPGKGGGGDGQDTNGRAARPIDDE
ncbi:transglycosylase domain-containing protein [Actinoallomurus iriomotensis]|uniref:transglycosylase domain-containing protein n=1 Tax=Actinoallomurus TaxID=667113 RepID=UPI0025533845|nr:transglycosylase domain-containing protein [Actinoallomurus iriomotensis]